MPDPDKVASDILRRASDGQIFAARFVKRTNREVRDMVCRLGVKTEVSKTPRLWNPWDHDLMQVWDLEKSGFRFINLPEVIRLRAGGDEIRYSVEQHTEEDYE